jgi:cyanophycinase
MHIIASLVLSLCAATTSTIQNSKVETPGTLVIAGGSLSNSNKAIWNAFVQSAKTEGPFVIMPTASGQPAASAENVRTTLISYGVPEEKISVARLAMIDDPSTPEIDESRWLENNSDEATISLLGSAAAIWFTGGDQSRTTKVLLTEGGKDTAAMTAIREAHATGATIGGTSAGAAIMSEKMLLQGDAISALTGATSGEQVLLGNGLGFFSDGLIDQHFGERARLGRLAKALSLLPDKLARIGYGIDEDTALIVSRNGGSMVLGNGYVTVLDAREADISQSANGAMTLRNMIVHMAAANDTIDINSTTLTAAEWKSATISNEYYDTPHPAGGGVALPPQLTQDIIGDSLLDNSSTTEVERISFTETGLGVRYVFRQNETSSGYWGRGPDGRARYTVSSVLFDIEPVKIEITDPFAE